MLELGSSTKTLVIGPSATLSDALLEHGAWGFVGSVVDDFHELINWLPIGGSAVR